MTVRTKASLAALAVSLIWIVVGVRFMSVVVGSRWMIAYIIGFVVFGNFLVFLAVRPFRCPQCGARFGLRSFVRYGVARPWIYEDCSDCGRSLDTTG